MSSLVLLQWVLPVRHPFDSAQQLIRGVVAPVVRAGGWLSSPDTTHHVRDVGREVWVTVITPVDDATQVQEDLSELLRSPPAVETGDDPLLAQGLEWYRAALQEITHVGLDALDAGRSIPLSEYEAFAVPSDAAPRLIPYLNEVSDTYRRTSATYEATERFWLAFFRRAPSPELSPAGHWLWNLGG